MAEKKSSKYDFFNLFLMSMACLTVLMTALCLFTAYQLNNAKGSLKNQVRDLEDVKKIIQDPEVKKLIARKKRGGSSDGKRVRNYLVQMVSKEGQLVNMAHSSREDRPGLIKDSYNVQISDISMRNLVRALYYIERLPGAKVENLSITRTERKFLVWDSNFTVSIFSSAKKNENRPGNN